jgi:ribosomal protein L11 methyltransferase
VTDWLEVSLSVDGESAEATAELLQRYGYQGVAIEQEGIMPEAWTDDEVPPASRLTIRAYLPVDSELEDKKARLESSLGHMSLMYPMPTPSYRQVQDADWAEAWKAHYHPVRLGRHILIRPLWIQVKAQEDDVVIALDPGMAFGTGTHPTTHLCLEALEDLTPQGGEVLDLGCGSGILAIAAAKFGAGNVLAVDNDPIAVEATVENREVNHVADKIEAEVGSLDTVIASGRQFDLVAANLIARVILAMSENGLGQIVKPGGVAVFSGIIEEQVPDIEVALRHTGLEPYHRRTMGDWVAIEARRSK